VDHDAFLNQTTNYGVVSKSRSLGTLSRCWDSNKTVKTSGEWVLEGRRQDWEFRTTLEKNIEAGKPIEKREI